MRDFIRERLREEGKGLVLRLQLSAVGERVAMHLDDAIGEQIFAAAIVVERAGNAERQREFTREAGVVFAHRRDVTVVVAKGDMQRRIRAIRRVDQLYATVALQRFAKLRADDCAGLGKESFVFNRFDVQRREREFPFRAELVMRTTAKTGKADNRGDYTDKKAQSHWVRFWIGALFAVRTLFASRKGR